VKIFVIFLPTFNKQSIFAIFSAKFKN